MCEALPLFLDQARSLKRCSRSFSLYGNKSYSAKTFKLSIQKRQITKKAQELNLAPFDY
jgi:hypothetical protein